MEEEISKKLVAFLYDRSRAPEVPITFETSIESDLGISGDDGEELILQYSKEFKVNIESFHFAEYFFPEPNVFLDMPEEVKILTVGHLLKGIIAGRLDDKVINS